MTKGKKQEPVKEISVENLERATVVGSFVRYPSGFGRPITQGGN